MLLLQTTNKQGKLQIFQIVKNLKCIYDELVRIYPVLKSFLPVSQEIASIYTKKLGYQSDHLDHNGHEDTVGKYISEKLFGQLNIHMNNINFLFLIVQVISSPGPQWP